MENGQIWKMQKQWQPKKNPLDGFDGRKGKKNTKQNAKNEDEKNVLDIYYNL